MSDTDDQDGPDVQDIDDCEDWTTTTAHNFAGMDVRVTLDSETVEGSITRIWEYKGDPTRIDVDVPDRDEPVNVTPGNDHVGVI